MFQVWYGSTTFQSFSFWKRKTSEKTLPAGNCLGCPKWLLTRLLSWSKSHDDTSSHSQLIWWQFLPLLLVTSLIRLDISVWAVQTASETLAMTWMYQVWGWRNQFTSCCIAAVAPLCIAASRHYSEYIAMRADAMLRACERLLSLSIIRVAAVLSWKVWPWKCWIKTTRLASLK